MRKRSFSITLVVVAFLFSSWSNVIAAAFCPRYSSSRNCHIQQRQADHKSSCQHEMADIEMGTMQMNDMDMESEAASETADNSIAENPPIQIATESSSEQVAIDFPTEPCGHCWMHSQPSSGTATVVAVDPSKRLVETNAPPANFVVALPSAFATPNETTTFYANYSRERYSSLLQSITKTGVPFDLRNRWNREDRNLNDSFGIGVTTYLAKGRLLLDANYALSLSNDRITTANLTTISPTAILNASAFPFPDVKSKYHELNIDTNYQLTDNAALGFRYIFEPYRLDDFQWNGLNPYPIDRLPAEQQFPTTRPLLLDSRYSSHNVHVFGVYLRFSKGKNTP